jgi:hypothetical protein
MQAAAAIAHAAVRRGRRQTDGDKSVGVPQVVAKLSAVEHQQSLYPLGTFVPDDLNVLVGTASTAEQAAAALSALSKKVDSIEPAAMATLSEAALENGALARMCQLLGAPVPAVQDAALSVLTHLTSAHINPKAMDARVMHSPMPDHAHACLYHVPSLLWPANGIATMAPHATLASPIPHRPSPPDRYRSLDTRLLCTLRTR